MLQIYYLQEFHKLSRSARFMHWKLKYDPVVSSVQLQCPALYPEAWSGSESSPKLYGRLVECGLNWK